MRNNVSDSEYMGAMEVVAKRNGMTVYDLDKVVQKEADRLNDTPELYQRAVDYFMHFGDRTRVKGISAVQMSDRFNIGVLLAQKILERLQKEKYITITPQYTIVWTENH